MAAVIIDFKHVVIISVDRNLFFIIDEDVVVKKDSAVSLIKWTDEIATNKP